jgi:two-component system CheB/CheR fusion protein
MIVINKITAKKNLKEKKVSKISKIKKTDANLKSDFPVVAIGASAGGLEALDEFFTSLPKNPGMAFVVIQHLDPNHTALLPELLQRNTTMTVMQVTDRLKINPNCVYVIPPNKSMSVLNGVLHLFKPVEQRGVRLPIDFFFRSLAEDKQEKSIGIILSGMGSDGSLGLKAIKEKNGIALVQEPETAKFDGMPVSAIAAVNADIVAPAGELPSKLIAFLNFTPAIKPDAETDLKATSNLEKIIILLRAQTGHDFSLYKKNTLFRRIERRMSVHQIDKIASYVRFLQENPKESEILFKELLIGVTSFFRDASVWKKLHESILPDLIRKMPNGHIIRAWIPACSTGEEAYSLAIVFKEVVEKQKPKKNITLQIFATDLDVDAIDIARKGVFPSNIAADVSKERLSLFFKSQEDGYRVNNAIREMVVFAPHNVIKDPPFTKMDFISCRNLLIYMEPELQKKLMNLFHYSLNPGGIMLLGNAETIAGESTQFTLMDTKFKLYKRSLNKLTPELLNLPGVVSNRKKNTDEEMKPMVLNESIQSLADNMLLQRFSPASVLVNEQGDIVYITGRTGKYLEPAAGKANMNIYSMAREGLRQELHGALHKAMQNYEPVILRNIKIGTNGDLRWLDVTVQQIEKPEAIKGTIIIVFTDVQPITEPASVKPKSGKQSAHPRLPELQLELDRRNEELQSTREEMQTSQEELKSANEELQSTNEELQSTNEELTTSKEEMQSLNEELQTLNAELQTKINEYARADNDMKNLLNSTDIATLFLDKELNIRRFTDQLIKIFKLRQTDIGRPFTDIVSDLQYPELENHAMQVLKTLVFVEEAIKTNDGRWYNVRIMPYRTYDDRIDGLVITFVDITIAKKLEAKLKKIHQPDTGK